MKQFFLRITNMTTSQNSSPSFATFTNLPIFFWHREQQNPILAGMGNATSTIAGNLVAKCTNPLDNSPLNCSTTFTDGSNSTVAFFGNVPFGTFQPDPDVAGIGVRHILKTNNFKMLIRSRKLKDHNLIHCPERYSLALQLVDYRVTSGSTS